LSISYIVDTNLPPQINELYSVVQSGLFFYDIEYGQWGLKIFSVDECIEKSTQYGEDGLLHKWVVGEFLGDLDLLVFDYYRKCLVVATPLDPESEWEEVGVDISDFFSKYLSYQGDKFWEFRDKFA